MLVLLLAIAGIGAASAADKGAAFAGCRAWIAEQEPFEVPQGYEFKVEDVPMTPTQGHCQVFKRHTSGTPWTFVYQLGYDSGCPAPTTWDTGTMQCFDQQQCLSKNDALGNAIQSTDTDTHGCNDGCAMSMGTNYTTTTLGGHTVFTGMMRYTGMACATNPTKPPNDPQPECRDIEGMSVCKRPDNKLCAKASNGNYVCWNPGETGEKTEGPTKQKRDAGPNPIPPNLSLPSGDNLVQQGPPVVTTESKPGEPTKTTNITNYNTFHGTNAGPTNQGEGGDGDGEEGEEGEEGTSTGGTNCETPPVTTGDPVGGMIATQAWSTRCATEAGNAAKVTGDVSNCAQPFSVEGTNANAVQLRAMRAQLCNGDENGNGAGNGNGGEE